MIEIFENRPNFRLKFDSGFVQICVTLVLNSYKKKNHNFVAVLVQLPRKVVVESMSCGFISKNVKF